GLAELAPATAALFSNLLSLVVRPAISEDAQPRRRFSSPIYRASPPHRQILRQTSPAKRLFSPAYRASPQYRQIWRRNLGRRARRAYPNVLRPRARSGRAGPSAV